MLNKALYLVLAVNLEGQKELLGIVIPLFAFPEDIRKMIYTTNAIESVNMMLRKVTGNHRIFPSDEAVYKVVDLAIRHIAKKWTMPITDWKPALNRVAIEFAGRFPQ